jgi:peroxiredoxin
MNRRYSIALLALILVGTVAEVWAASLGQPAPSFTAADTNGKVRKLSDFNGKFLVLEWTNRDCPYTRKHYQSGNMERLQHQWTARGVVWLTVQSSAPGEQGYVIGGEENAYLADMKAAPTAVLLDPTGQLGHLYDAKTTPHMFVINPKGVLIYDGAIDDRPTTDASDIPKAKNYVAQALEEAMAGKPVSVPTSRPYGCSVKYAEK